MPAFCTGSSELDIGTLGSVLFSDETRICLYGSNRRRKVYRRPRERFAECCIEKRIAYGDGSCLIWGAISMGAQTDPVFIRRDDRGRGRGGLTGARYIEEILAIYVVPYVDYIGVELMRGRALQESCKITLQKSFSGYGVANMQFRPKPNRTFMG